MNENLNPLPVGNFAGIKSSFKYDVVSGFFVFLIALPLCLGISLASGYPAIAGIFTAIVGGLLATFISNSELTIKGPAAGMIVIALGCVTEFGFTGGEDPTKDFQAYRLALGIGVAAGVLQVIFGLFRTGVLGELFPIATIHGLLAAIGIIIVAKQFPIMLGLHPHGSPLELILKIPTFLSNLNPVISLIGIISLAIILSSVFIKISLFKIIPAPMLVLLVAIPSGLYFGLGEDKVYTLGSQIYELNDRFLVNVPINIFDAITFPDFSGLFTETGIKYIILFAIIGSIESLLSAKAIDQIDPWNRKTNLDRDMIAIGLANTLSSFIGGLPMISEIVRSKANIDNGARTRFSNFFHGIFLLFCVALIPVAINHIPLSALAALLVFTGFRLASPKEFIHMYHLGKDQLIIFLSTIVGVLETDLLKGVFIGIGVNIFLQILNGARIHSFLKLNIKIQKINNSVTIIIREAALFTTWMQLRKHIIHYLNTRESVALDFSDVEIIDFTIKSNVCEMMNKFKENGLELSVHGMK